MIEYLTLRVLFLPDNHFVEEPINTLPVYAFLTSDLEEIFTWVETNLKFTHSNSLFYWLHSKELTALELLRMNDLDINLGVHSSMESFMKELYYLDSLMKSASERIFTKYPESTTDTKSVSSIDYLNDILSKYTTGTPEI